MGRDSGQATDAFKLLKMFVKGKGPFEFERPHHGEACAVGKTEILVSVSFKNIKRRVLNRRGNCDNFNEAALLQVLAEKDSDMMRNPRPEVIHRLADNEVCGDKPRPLFLCISVKGSSSFVVFIICICETGGQKKAKIDQQSAEVGLGHEHKNLVGKPYECY